MRTLEVLLAAEERMWIADAYFLSAPTLTQALMSAARTGSTNLNFSGLLANWEVDLMVEDAAFGVRMEKMFEEDLANSREVRLGGMADARRPRPPPEWGIGKAEQRDALRARRGGAASAEASGGSGRSPLARTPSRRRWASGHGRACSSARRRTRYWTSWTKKGVRPS